MQLLLRLGVISWPRLALLVDFVGLLPTISTPAFGREGDLLHDHSLQFTLPLDWPLILHARLWQQFPKEMGEMGPPSHDGWVVGGWFGG